MLPLVSLLITSCFSLSSSSPGANLNNGILAVQSQPNIQSYQFSSQPHPFLSISWKIVENNLQFLLSISDPNAFVGNAWISVGFGSHMIAPNTQFVVCHYTSSTDKIAVHEHIGTLNYQPPLKQQGNWSTLALSGLKSSSSFSCEFSRPIQGDGIRNSIKTTSLQPILWAFSFDSPINWSGTYFSYHGIDQRGVLSALLSSGQLSAFPPSLISNKEIHGYGMAIVFLILFPSSIAYARLL